MKFEGKYYLGLDMGTNSVGWAVTDEKYNILRISGKDMWGVREFDEAKTSVERRMHRTGRRGRQREQARVGLLKAIFSRMGLTTIFAQYAKAKTKRECALRMFQPVNFI